MVDVIVTTAGGVEEDYIKVGRLNATESETLHGGPTAWVEEADRKSSHGDTWSA